MELVVKVVDLSYNEENEILKKSETLKGYSRLIFLIRKGVKEQMGLEESIDNAVVQCIEEGHLVEFLIKYGREIGNMLFEEVTWDEVIAIRSEDVYEEGLAEGIAKGKNSGIIKLIKSLSELDISKDVIAKKLYENYNLSEEEIEKYLNEVLQ